jgi:GNAT superfamily N-acetyltransferase
MAFEIQPLLKSDTLDLIKLYYEAFKDSIVPILFSSPPSESSYVLMAAERARILAKPRTRAFKAVDRATGRMVGAVYWRVAPEGLSQEELDSDAPGFEYFAPEQKVDAWRVFGRRLGECYARVVGTEPSVEVALLIVDPGWQGKGVGSKLLEWGCGEADRYVCLFRMRDGGKMLMNCRLGCVAYVEASDVGVRAYGKAGFEVVGTIDFDASPWGHVGKFPVNTVSHKMVLL